MLKSTMIVTLLVFLFGTQFSGAQTVKPFKHPGMAQSRADLDFMKQKVNLDQEPWKTAFENLKAAASLSFKPELVAHISVGPYGANSKGGRELSQSANAVYAHALMWYITGKKEYAQKAIEILNAWSYTLWDFDDNNAKLNVGLTAYNFLNAAEILKYSPSGWQQKDIEQFKKMMLTVYYPTVRDFFTEANGNWDASIINTLLCIGVFTNNREIFNRAIERYKRGPGNSGITKYIYPNGQIQETTRDWGHVQLGIGEFAKAAQVAFTQDADFYADAGNRLALGFEFTAAFLTGKDIPVYGILSLRDRDELRDIYEAIYDHYTQLKGMQLPNTQEIIERTRPKSWLGVLTGIRAPLRKSQANVKYLQLSFDIPSVNAVVGAGAKPAAVPPADAIMVSSADSLQQVLDKYKGKQSWIVLKAGAYVLKAPLKIYSDLTLSGQGKTTILTLAPGSTGKTILNADDNMQHVTICDMLIEGANNLTTNADPNHDRRTRSYMSAQSREGIVFSADQAGRMNSITFENLTVQNFTKNGVLVSGGSNIAVNNCDFSDNGSSVVPGSGLLHNLHVSRSAGLLVTNSRFDTSPWGNGIALSYVTDGKIENCEAARNKLSGVNCIEVKRMVIKHNLFEGNDLSGIELEVLTNGNKQIRIIDNLIQYNGVFGVHPASGQNVHAKNTYHQNGIKSTNTLIK